jgi:hypothetical protein
MRELSRVIGLTVPFLAGLVGGVWLFVSPWVVGVAGSSWTQTVRATTWVGSAVAVASAVAVVVLPALAVRHALRTLPPAIDPPSRELETTGGEG